MDFTWLGIQICICWSQISEILSVSGVTTISFMQHNTYPLRRVDQVVDCGLWDVVQLLFNGCAKLLGIGRNWNTLWSTLIQIIPNMLNGNMSGEYAGHGRTGTFSASRNCVQTLETWGSVLSCWNMRWWWRMNVMTMGLRISSRYLCAFTFSAIKCNCVCCL